MRVVRKRPRSIGTDGHKLPFAVTFEVALKRSSILPRPVVLGELSEK
jgi:hypothetical protein